MCLRHTLTQRGHYTGNFRRNSKLTAHLRDVKKKKKKEMSKVKLQIQIYKLRLNEELDVFMQDKITFMCIFLFN